MKGLHCFLLTALSLVSVSSLNGANASSKKPNILFIVSDDLKPLLGCYGASWIQSPNIDRLAQRGTVFKSNYCQVAFCAPTRFSLLTGLRPDTTGMYLNPEKAQDLLRTRLPDVVTLPQLFKNHGYITHPLHKVFDGRTVDQTHDAVSWTVPYGPWEMAPGEKPAPGGYQDPVTKARLAEAITQGKPASGPPTEACDIPDNAYHDGGVAQTAAKRIREFANKKDPFFLAVGFVKPHMAFIAPKKYWDLYDRAALPLAPFQELPAGSPHDLAFYSNSGELREREGVPKAGPIAEALQRELIHGYAACVSYIDAQVGLLMKTLDETGIADNTIICFWGDHGWHLGEHGHWGKLTNYEDAARAPLIISAPGFSGGVKASGLTEFLDVYPTLCELAGLPTPTHVEGKSLVTLMRGKEVSIHKAAMTQMSRGTGKHATMGWSMRTSRYRYIEWRSADFSHEKPVFGSQTLAIELYDYQTDPHERENIAGKAECAALLAEQQRLFDDLLPHLPRRLG
jgi:arylsulfatase A-like enzyme